MSILNNSTSPAIRTSIQAALAEGAIRLVEVVPNPDLDISAGDRAIIWIVVTGVISLAQNFVENQTGMAFIKRVPDPPLPENDPAGA